MEPGLERLATRGVAAGSPADALYQKRAVPPRGAEGGTVSTPGGSEGVTPCTGVRLVRKGVSGVGGPASGQFSVTFHW